MRDVGEGMTRTAAVEVARSTFYTAADALAAAFRGWTDGTSQRRGGERDGESKFAVSGATDAANKKRARLSRLMER